MGRGGSGGMGVASEPREVRREIWGASLPPGGACGRVQEAERRGARRLGGRASLQPRGQRTDRLSATASPPLLC